MVNTKILRAISFSNFVYPSFTLLLWGKTILSADFFLVGWTFFGGGKPFFLVGADFFIVEFLTR